MKFQLLLPVLVTVYMNATQSYAVDCSSIEEWTPTAIFNDGNQTRYNGIAYKANWWTQGNNPEERSGPWQEWTLLGACENGVSNEYYAIDCSGLEEWTPAAIYVRGDLTQSNGNAYKANWWTQSNNPKEHSGSWQEWTILGGCEGDETNRAPTVTLTFPSSDSSFTENDTYTFSAQARDSDGSIDKVEFYLDGELQATDFSPPYSLDWTAVAGTHSVYAKAYDNNGATAETAANSIAVEAAANESPGVALAVPHSATSFEENDSIVISADAIDSDGTITKVEFYVDGVLIGTDTTTPFSATWEASLGDHIIFARAEDNQNATAQSSSITVTVEGEATGNPLACRPDGLYTTPNTYPNYCDIYDADGREIMGSDHPRRIIGYFTSWRTGANGQPGYLVKDIPWEKITHINYAFAHIDDKNHLSVGNPSNSANAAIGAQWPGVAGAESDPDFDYQGHFNQLSKFKKKYPNVKTLISVGGWAETGGYFNQHGDRIDSGGFYTMTTNADGGINYAGIETFANSAVKFIRTFGFDGVDIDYEYPTSMNDAGNPSDFFIANNLRGALMDSYVEMMRVLRAKLDRAGEEDGTHYLLTIASPASSYLLRGMETMQVVQYIDYVNIMTYDMHGSWNEYVGHQAALYDTGDDPELQAANIYDTHHYGGIGFLNTDWAVKYFRGSLQAGRINIGIPYYTRGWQGVSGSINGLKGRAPLTNQSNCPAGTGGAVKCGNGAMGINNLWHDIDDKGNEIGSGASPIWHAKNLQEGIWGSYARNYGLDPKDPQDQMTGDYVRYYDSVAVAPWLWNEDKNVFLSMEDEESIDTKVQYVIDTGLGGIMVWELAGDYDWNASRGEYFIGSKLTNLAYDKFKTAKSYSIKRSIRETPREAVDIIMAFDGFLLGEHNHPLTPKLRITNKSGIDIPGGTVFEFDIPTSTSDMITDISGAGLEVIVNGANAGGGNVGGLENEFHRVRFVLPDWQSIPKGGNFEITMNYYLPISGPQSFQVTIDGKDYAISSEYPELPIADLSSEY